MYIKLPSIERIVKNQRLFHEIHIMFTFLAKKLIDSEEMTKTIELFLFK